MLRSLLALGCSSALLLGCTPEPTYQPGPPAVTVALPAQRDVVVHAEFSGTTVPGQSAPLHARTTGYLSAIGFESGDLVEQDQLLFQLDPRAYEAALAAAQAEKAIRAAELDQKEVSLARKESALEDDAISELEVLQARADRDVAAAMLDAAKASVRMAEIDLEWTEIRAPFAGTIARSAFEVGELVGADPSTPLTTLINDSEIEVSFFANERDYLRALRKERNQPQPDTLPIELGVLDEQGFPHAGLVDYIEPQVDAETGTIEVRARFDNASGELKAGLFVRLRIEAQQLPQALLVPETALAVDQAGRYVLVVDESNIAQRHDLELGPLLGQERVVLSGLEPGERVIVNGLQRVRAGAPVSPQLSSPQLSSPQPLSPGGE